jgi:hypothetical protein
MFGADPNVGESALRLWVAVGSAALLVCISAMAFDWTRSRIVVRISVIALGAVLGATLAWTFLNGASDRDRSAERRDLEMRAAQLNAQSLAFGSPLACLNGLIGDDVEAACEKALFASPATVAVATSYAAAQLTLLADMVVYTKRGGADLDSALVPLQRSLEADRFGFVAQVLARRDGCSSNSCPALALLHDSTRVRANLSGQTLARYVDHYLTAWAQPADMPPAADASAQSSAAPQPAASGQHKIVDIDFPSAASIPAVSIMNPEPSGPPAAAALASATAGSRDAAGTSPAPSKPRKQPANPPAQAAAAPPPPSDPPVDAIWTPRTTAPAAPPSPSAATIAGPVQLNPRPAPPQASAGGANTQ